MGYMGEAFILECTALGLGTCWLGVSYNKGALKKLIRLEEGEELVCAASIGIPAESYIGRPRMDLTKLTTLTEEQLQALPAWQQQALACARIAPSAVNAQPWRFLVAGEEITVKRAGSNFGYAALDCGIAMLHIELGASHGGVSGEWKQCEGNATFCPVPQG